MPNANTAASLLKSMFKNERIDVLVPSDIVTVSFVLFTAHHITIVDNTSSELRPVYCILMLSLCSTRFFNSMYMY